MRTSRLLGYFMYNSYGLVRQTGTGACLRHVLDAADLHQVALS